jgi:hypothetical protein
MPSPDFEPERHTITAITNAINAAVTTLAAHGYDDGETVMIYVPNTYGMHLDYIETRITVTGATTFTCDLDTQRLDPFVVPGVGTVAHVCPVSQAIDNIAT